MAASAVADPDTPPIRVLITTEIWAVPPYIRRVRSRARLRSRSVIPDTFIKFPAKIKKGTAKNAKDWLWATIIWVAVSKVRYSTEVKKANPARPMTKAMGIPRTKNVTKQMSNKVI
jgi:hypothetical protein